jgi:putative sterol carrier protein
VVQGAPDGESGYEVRITDGVALLLRAGSQPADLTITCDYDTAAGIMSGRLSAQAALAAGRVRLSGDLRVLTAVAAAGVDPLPAELRSATEVPG